MSSYPDLTLKNYEKYINDCIKMEKSETRNGG